jgi:PadR family transcriptional regulator, regulatory protein PadR
MTNTDLTQAMTLILIALKTGIKNGHAILTEIERLTDGEYPMTLVTVHRSIEPMIDRELIIEVRGLAAVDRRYRQYAITLIGRAALDAEIQRLARLIQIARKDLR